MRRFVSKALVCVIAALAATAAIAAELKLRPPPKPFDEYSAPPSPDYAKADSWVVTPEAQGKSTLIPPNIKGEIAEDPKADVFFVHPTTFLTNTSWNARFDEPGFTLEQLDTGVVRYQVGVFNGCCRIFAPRYRQATLSAFVNPGADANKAFELAYSDVLRAFDFFLDKPSKGRPFILASHSQGSLHAVRLLQERIIARPELRKRLVAAYVIGQSQPETIEYTGLPVCNSARQMGCVINWNSATSLTLLALGRRNMVTYADGGYQRVGTKTWTCVNPLSWDGKSVSPPSANKGSLPIAGHDKPLPDVIAGVTGAKCARGRLVVDIPRSKRDGFTDPMTSLGSYHNQDYSLFYAAIRQNAIDRVAEFAKK